MAASLATETASKRQMMVVAVVAVVLVIMAAFGFAWSNLMLGRQPAFLPFFAGVLLVTDLLTAYMLAAQFRITRLPSLMMLSCAFFFSGLIIVPHMLMFPGVISDAGILGAGPQSAIWMWVFWHGGFPLFVIGFALVRRREGTDSFARRHPGSCALAGLGAVALLVAALAWLASGGRDWLPSLIAPNGSFTDLSHSFVGFEVLGSNILALALVLIVTRCRTIGSLGLVLAVLASLLDAALTLHSQSRYSLGWYLARVNSIVSSGSILAFFLYELSWLYYKIADLNESLGRLAFIDELTGLANRRQFEERIKLEWSRAGREGRELAVIMIDVDFFKKYNDRYGHPAGDECLRLVARAIGATVRRPADMAARYGGEEFIVILPGVGADGAAFVAKQIGDAIRKLAIRHEGGLGIVTVSQGVAALTPKDHEPWTTVTEAADTALYAAKNAGRNTIAISSGQTAAGSVAVSLEQGSAGAKEPCRRSGLERRRVVGAGE